MFAGAPARLDGDSAALGIAGYTSGTGPLVGLWIERGDIAAPEPVEEVFQRHLQHNRARMESMTLAASELPARLLAAGIPVTFLQGTHTAHANFPASGARPAADIDLLVRPSDARAAGEALTAAGFRPGAVGKLAKAQSWSLRGMPAEPRNLAFVHAQDPWSVDLHTTLDRRYSAGAPPVRLDRLRDHAPAAPWPVLPQARVLGQPLLLLHLAVHACCGLSSLSLLRLAEMVMVIRSGTADGSLRWPDFVAQAERADGLGLIYPALRLCEALAPGTVPDAVIAASAAHVRAAVRRVVDPLSPADAQRVTRCSLAERFMWTGSPWRLARQIASDIVPGRVSWRDFAAIYASRAWRVARGTISR